MSEMPRAIARGSPASTRSARVIAYFRAGRISQARGAPPPRVGSRLPPRAAVADAPDLDSNARPLGHHSEPGRRSSRKELAGDDRSEERRVGKEGRGGWSRGE